MSLSQLGGNQYASAGLLVVDSTHPIAAGLPSTFYPTVNSSALMQSVYYTYLPSGADPVAARASTQQTATTHVVYTISTGAALADGTAAPGNRVVLGLTEVALENLSDDGAQLVYNALDWADPWTDDGVTNGPVGAHPATVNARWEMNEGATASTMVDSISPTENGSIGNRVTTAVTDGTGAKGYKFPTDAADDNDDERLVSASASNLNPYTNNLTFGARFKPGQLGNVDGYNIIQKGQAGQSLQQNKGQYKLELLSDSTIRCDFVGLNAKGDPVSAGLPANVKAQVGQWIKVTCVKTRTQIKILVNDHQVGALTKTIGNIHTTLPMTLAGKWNCGGSVECDYFRGGTIDYAFVRSSVG